MFGKEHIAFIKTQQIVGDKTPQDWKYFFEDLELSQEKREKNQKFLRRIQLILVLFTVFLFILGTDFIKNPAHLGISFGAIFLVWVLLRIEMARNKLIKTKNPSFLNDIRYFVLPLINVLEKDIKQGSILHLELDLREPYWTAEFKKSTYKRNGWNVSFHQFVFIKLRATFEDKIILDFMIMDKFKKLERTKRSASGRTKSKRKFKGKTSYIAKVAFPSNKFSSVEKLEQKKGRIIKTAKNLQINTREDYHYYTKKAYEAIANAFLSVQKV